jgi:hypothetical protein
MAEASITDHMILAIFPAEEDRPSLDQFSVARIGSCCSIEPVITAGRLHDRHSWKDLLKEVQQMANPPPLLVTDRLAGEVLWAEVLNLGAYDL